MDSFLANLFKKGKISFEDVITYSYDPESVKAQLAAEGVIDEEVAKTAVKKEGIEEMGE